MIDVVIAWVDGDDPAHKAKRARYLTGRQEDRLDDIAGTARFRSAGEIEFCVGSVLRFAPFVHKIYIVTDGQDPHLQPFVERNFPGNTIPIEIVDHKVLFRGYEQYLPTFNSLSIETMLFRIPGLSENFVYFNDDFMVAAPLKPEDWFVDGKAVCYGTRFSAAFARFLRWIKPRKNGHKPFGYKDAMLNAADVLGTDYFWYIPHAPIALCRSRYEKFYEEHPQLLEQNIRYRFRDPVQFNPQILYYILAEREGGCIVRPGKGRAFFLKPAKGRKGYVARKLAEADSNDRLLFGCVNSFDQASDEEKAMFRTWLEKRMDVKF